MSDDNRINPASPGDFLGDPVLSRLGFTRPGPSDDTLASLEAAMARGRLTALLGARKISFSKGDRRWLREAHRAGTIDIAELDELEVGSFPYSASQWPAADLLVEMHEAPEKLTRTVIRVQVREDHPPSFRFSAFINIAGADQWFAVEPFTLSRDGKTRFERRLVLDPPLLRAVVAENQLILIEAAALVSARHQRLTAKRH